MSNFLMQIQTFPWFQTTDENLEAVVSGMDLSPEDRVVAICGSGDQAFAMLESAGSVTAVDFVEVQIEFVKKRAQLLQKGKYEDFLAVGVNEDDRYRDLVKQDAEKRNPYFQVPGRLSKIRDKLAHLDFIEGKIFTVAPTLQPFSRLYLSGTMGQCGENERIAKAMKQTLDNLEINGLIYVTMGTDPFERMLDMTPTTNVKLSGPLTTKARDKERLHGRPIWEPTVYRKVS